MAAFCALGGFAEVAVAPEFFTFPLSDELDFAQGAGLILNYHTAWFALRLRGRLAEGETVLVHGAAGGVGTAALQVAKGLGARTIAVVSTDDKEQVARDAGADEVVRSDGSWKDEAKELSGGGVDVVLDPGRRRPLPGQHALAGRGWAAGRGRVHRRLDPGGEGQPPAAEQHRGRGRGMGRLRDAEARPEPGDRHSRQPAGGRRASCGRSSARASGPSRRPRR